MDTAIIITKEITLKGVYIWSEDKERIWVNDDLNSDEQIGVPKDEIISITRIKSEATSLTQIKCYACQYNFLAMHEPKYLGEFCCPECNHYCEPLNKWNDNFACDGFYEFKAGEKIRMIKDD